MKYHSLDTAGLDWAWLGRVDYEVSERLQDQSRKARSQGIHRDRLLLLEHPPVITMGRSAQPSDILVQPDFLAAQGVTVHRSERGGQVTVHAPGQLVGYLIVDIRARRWSVPEFVHRVSRGLGIWCESLGVATECRKAAPGLWFGDAKLASVGFHIRKGISCHGFALNLQPDLELFDWIIPCGARTPVTSVSKILDRKFAMEETATAVAAALARAFTAEGIYSGVSSETSSVDSAGDSSVDASASAAGTSSS